MGYKRDFYSKRDLKRTTNVVSGIITGLIVAPFAALDALSKYDVPTSSNDTPMNNNRSNARKHNTLIRFLSKKTNRSINSDYKNKIESYNLVKKKLDSLEIKIGLCKDKLRILGFIPQYKEKRLRLFKELVKEKLCIKDTCKSPVICLDKYSSSYRKNTKITGHVLLLLNREIKTGDFLEENAICRRIDTNNSFFELSKAPNAKFTFGSIEFFFYDDMMLIMIDKDFVVVENNDYNLDYRVVHFDAVGVHLPGCSTHWHNVGVIDIKTYSQTISLLFFKKGEGDHFYNLIQRYRKPQTC